MTQPTSTFPRPDPENLESFLMYVRNLFPGGDLISDQWHSQPFTPVLLGSAPGTSDPVTRTALDAYPAIAIPVPIFEGEDAPYGFSTPRLRIVPRFIEQLLHWRGMTSTDTCVPDALGHHTPLWETHPDDEQILTFISQLRGCSDITLMPYPDGSLLTGLSETVAAAGWNHGMLLLNDHLYDRCAAGDTVADLYGAVHDFGIALRGATA